jgi:pimeloyl-ACP methyl ester carboxylesterase
MEGLFTHRTRRAWADACARAGTPAVRIDLPGFDDSPGSPLDHNRLEAWTAAVASAARWLGDEIGCGRVAAVGIGLGGMLAWLATAQGAPIDDLVLWGVPTRGRRLLREVRAAAALDIEAELEPESPTGSVSCGSPAVADDGCILDAAGLITTKETIDSLARLDLTKLQLPDAARRRVLLFKRSEVTADQQVHEYFDASGAEVTVADGDSYGAMMRYAELSTLPAAVITRSLSWLSGADASAKTGPKTPENPPRAASENPPTGRVRALPSLEMLKDGVAIRETPITAQVASVTLRGILTEPVGVPPTDLCAVFFSGGADSRVGPNRLWVELARRWAAKGLSAVRIDPQGIGDSDGDDSYWVTRRAHYDSRHVGYTIELLDELEALGLPGRFLLVGFCSGAWRSVQAAGADSRVAGVFAIAYPFFFCSWWKFYVRNSWVSGWQRHPHHSLSKAAAGWTLRTSWRIHELARRAYLRHLHRRPDKVDSLLDRLRDQGTETLLLFRPDALEYEDLCITKQIDKLREMPTAQALRMPGSDVRFRPLAAQQFVSDALDDALSRVRQSNGNTAFATSQNGHKSTPTRLQRRRSRVLPKERKNHARKPAARRIIRNDNADDTPNLAGRPHLATTTPQHPPTRTPPAGDEHS